MDDTKRSLVAESAVRQLKLYGYESKQSGDDNYETFRKITYSPEGQRLQELVQEQLRGLGPAEAHGYPKQLQVSAQQQKEMQTVIPVMWEQVQALTDKQDDDLRTVLLVYGSSVLCIEICRPVNPDVDAPSPDQYGQQLFALEKEAVKTLQQVTGRQVALTAIELMALFGVKDPQKESENLSLFASVSTSQHGEELQNLVRKILRGSTCADPILMMKGILPIMWDTILEIAKEDPEEMQFVLMVYGTAVLITEVEREYTGKDLSDLKQKTVEHIKQQKFAPPKFLTPHSSSLSKIFSPVTSYFSGLFPSSKKD